MFKYHDFHFKWVNCHRRHFIYLGSFLVSNSFQDFSSNSINYPIFIVFIVLCGTCKCEYVLSGRLTVESVGTKVLIQTIQGTWLPNVGIWPYSRRLPLYQVCVTDSGGCEYSIVVYPRGKIQTVSLNELEYPLMLKTKHKF